MPLVACAECDGQVSSAAHACPRCGYPMQIPARPSPPAAPNRPSRQDVERLLTFQVQRKSKAAGYLLWFFLGGLGAHRYYVGRIGSGVGLLVLTGLFGLLVIFALEIPWYTNGAMAAGAVWAIWLVYDLAHISSWIEDHNMRLVRKGVRPTRDARARADRYPGETARLIIEDALCDPPELDRTLDRNVVITYVDPKTCQAEYSLDRFRGWRYAALPWEDDKHELIYGDGRVFLRRKSG
jgi:TM2 domain-containing membrane protein YozV